MQIIFKDDHPDKQHVGVFNMNTGQWVFEDALTHPVSLISNRQKKTVLK
jgi:hypothetical protein